MRFLTQFSKPSSTFSKRNSQQSSNHSLFYHPVIVVIVSILCLLFYLSLDRSAQKAATSSETVEVLEEEIKTIDGNVAVLESQLELANHPVSQEKVIRNELLLQKPGEYIVQLPEVSVSESTPNPTATPTPWEEWKKVLF